MNSLHYFIPRNKLYSFAMYHLLEHVLAKKIQDHINSNSTFSGSIFSAETFLDGINIDIYNTDYNAINGLKEVLLNINLSTLDDRIIRQEAEVISNEVLDTDMLEEELSFHKIFEYIDGEKISCMNQTDFNYNEFLAFSFEALSLASMVLRFGNTIKKLRNPYWEPLSYPKHVEGIEGKFIIGAYIQIPKSVDDIFESMVASYLLGQRDDSIIQLNYMRKHGLYIGYSQHLAYRNALIVTYLMETNESLLLSYSRPFIPHCKQVEAENIYKELCTYFLYSDPLYTMFSRMFAKINSEELSFCISEIPIRIKTAIHKFIDTGGAS